MAELLLQVLSQSPDRLDLRLKLLDVYFDSGNKEGFIREAVSYKKATQHEDLMGMSKDSLKLV